MTEILTTALQKDKSNHVTTAVNVFLRGLHHITTAVYVFLSGLHHITTAANVFTSRKTVSSILAVYLVKH